MIAQLLFNGLWEGAIIVGLTICVLRLLPSINAATRYALWFAALLALVAVPPLSAGLHLGWHLIAPGLVHAPAGGGSFSLVPLTPLTAGAARWLTWPSTLGANVTAAVAAFWIAGSLVALARVAVSFARIRAIRLTATQVSQIDGVPVLASRRLAVPIATGVAAPIIVVPGELLESFPASDLRCTLEHELAHVRRGDVVSNAVQRIIEGLLFWNPWTHVIARQLIAEREAACDDWAVRRVGDATDYASSLAELAQRLTRRGTPLLTPSAFGSPNTLVARIERLTSGHAAGDSKVNVFALSCSATLFIAMTVALQFLVAPAGATEVAEANGGGSGYGCKYPNADPEVTDPVRPDLPRSQWPSHKVSAIVEVTVAPDGKAAAARIYRSSGDPNVDRAVLAAAETTKYSPKVVNCAPVRGSYLFRADFAP
jgi:TonB family protein